MPGFARDEDREHRIDMEVVVDAYDAEERRMGWYYYLDNRLNFPFQAKWSTQRQKSVGSGSIVSVTGMASEDECDRDMLVEILYKEGTLEDSFVVPLANLEPLDADDETQEAIADWHYWVDQGYEF